MFPTTAGPVLIPMPISRGGHPLAKKFAVLRLARDLHLDRAGDRAPRVVIEGLGRAEDGEQPVPEEVHNVPTMAPRGPREPRSDR